MRALLFLLWISCSLISQMHGLDPELDLRTIIQGIDDLYRSKSCHAKIAMDICTKHWKRTLKLEAWSEGKEQTFILIHSPKKEKGVATLRKDHQMWNYFPKINKVIKVPPSMMMGSWMGSDFTNDDLVKESSLLKDYNAHIIEDKNLNKDTLLISLSPKDDATSLWSEIRLLVLKQSFIPLEQNYYNRDGKKIRTLYFKGLQNIEGRKIPTVLEMIPWDKKGHKTSITYQSLSFDKPLDPNTFSLKNLKKKRS